MTDRLTDDETALIRHLAGRAIVTDPRVDPNRTDLDDVEDALYRTAHDVVDGVYYDGPVVEPLASDDDVEQLADEIESAALEDDVVDVDQDDLLEWASRLRQIGVAKDGGDGAER